MSGPFFEPRDLDWQSLAGICREQTDLASYPYATEIVKRIVIYDGTVLRAESKTDATRRALAAEFATCLKDGPGVLLVRAAYDDLTVIDRGTRLFQQIGAQERTAGQGQGDHFGRNERIWNSLQKVCLADPELFVEYYGNPLLHMVCEAWLGPNFQITAQVNNILPGGQAQSFHRDYHLGLQSNQAIARYPVHAQVMSQFLTLQGAIAHCDMPLEMGPTLLLPHSQRFVPGYLATGEPEFAAYFAEHHVQLPLAKGDMLCFNPAVFHAGGANTSSSDRVANLLQVSSSFGQTMESLNHEAMIAALYPVLQRSRSASLIPDAILQNALAAAAGGYAFPTNLDADPPLNGLAPASQRDRVWSALEQGWSWDKLRGALQQHDSCRQA